MFKTLATLILSILFSAQAVSQVARSSDVSANYKYGYLITHRDEIDSTLRGLNPLGFDILYSIKTTGSKDWHHYWRFPNYGFSVGYLNLGNKEALGSSAYFTFFFEKLLLKKKSKNQLRYRIGFGASYSNKVYDAQENLNNTLISLPLNFVMEGALHYQYQISRLWNIQAGLNLTHYSNGAVKFPNIGVNIPSFNFGLSYHISGEHLQDETAVTFPAFEKSQHLACFFYGGLQSAGQEYDDLDLAWTLSGQYIWSFRPKFSLVSGIDVTFNNASRKTLKNETANRYRVGLSFGQQFEMGKTSFLTQVGVYIYRPEKELDEAIYFRWGMKHQLSDRLMLSYMIKTHYARANLIELGFGYKILK